jgi:hypothetical protein
MSKLESLLDLRSDILDEIDELSEKEVVLKSSNPLMKRYRSVSQEIEALQKNLKRVDNISKRANIDV